MSDSETAWLEVVGGHKVPLGHACSIGRSRSNQLVLDDSRVSRQHAVIQAQGDGRHLIVDFGSANGTRVNGRRVILPTELRDGAEIEIAGMRLTFRREASGCMPDPERTNSVLTVREVRRVACWLFVADIVDSTMLVRTLSPEELPHTVGSWFVECRGVLEGAGGVITQYTGDGFLAHWADVPGAGSRVWGALGSFRQRQERAAPAFRFVLHWGTVSVAGSLQPGEENLMGPDVHFVFRLEGLAKALNRSVLVSEAASRHLAGVGRLEEVGQYSLKGFDGKHAVYSC